MWKFLNWNTFSFQAQYDEIQNRKKSVAPESASEEEKDKLLIRNIPETQTEEDLSRLTETSHLDDVFLWFSDFKKYNKGDTIVVSINKVSNQENWHWLIDLFMYVYVGVNII